MVSRNECAAYKIVSKITADWDYAQQITIIRFVKDVLLSGSPTEIQTCLRIESNFKFAGNSEWTKTDKVP